MVASSKRLLVFGQEKYELETNPKLIYFEKVERNGDKPHAKCIINSKVDKNYLLKVLKSDTIPFYEISITKMATFEKLLEIMRQAFEEEEPELAAVPARLLIEEQIIDGDKLKVTLGTYGISLG